MLYQYYDNKLYFDDHQYISICRALQNPEKEVTDPASSEIMRLLSRNKLTNLAELIQKLSCLKDDETATLLYRLLVVQAFGFDLNNAFDVTWNVEVLLLNAREWSIDLLDFMLDYTNNAKISSSDTRIMNKILTMQNYNRQAKIISLVQHMPKDKFDEVLVKILAPIPFNIDGSLYKIGNSNIDLFVAIEAFKAIAIDNPDKAAFFIERVIAIFGKVLFKKGEKPGHPVFKKIIESLFDICEQIRVGYRFFYRVPIKFLCGFEEIMKNKYDMKSKYPALFDGITRAISVERSNCYLDGCRTIADMFEESAGVKLLCDKNSTYQL